MRTRAGDAGGAMVGEGVSDEAARVALHRILRRVRQLQLHPGDQLPSQETLRAGLRLTNRAIDAAMAALVRHRVLTRRRRSGTCLLGFDHFPLSEFVIAVLAGTGGRRPLPPSHTTVLGTAILSLVGHGCGIRIFPSERLEGFAQPGAAAFTGLREGFAAEAVDALLLPMTHVDRGVAEECERQGLPALYCGASDDYPGSVLIDFRHLGERACDRLVAAGVARIAVAMHDQPREHHADLWQGVLAAAAGHGIAPDRVFHVDSGLVEGIEGGHVIGRRLLARPEHERPTGIVCPDDWLALGVQQVAREAGWAPQFAVQTNLQLPQRFPLPTWQFAVDLDAMARLAVGRLLDRLRKPWEEPSVAKMRPDLLIDKP